MSSLTRREQMCSMCEAEPQDMLILTCRHNLCLDCATQLYNLNTKNDSILCEICLSSTPLDSDTIVCLRSLSAKAINQEVKVNSYVHASELTGQKDLRNYPPIPKSQYNANQAYQPNQQYPVSQQLPLIQQQQTLPRCQKHNQPLTYYCQQCNNYKICSQCMLLQNHRYHKVVTLKKASLQIRQTIQKVGRQKIQLKNLLQKDKQSLHIRKQQSQKQLESNLTELKNVLDEIIQKIGLRYQQLKRQMEQQAQRKLEIMEGAINEIEHKITLIEETVQFQHQLVSSCAEQQFGGMFQIFDYYESQMTRNRVNFQPSLPSFISQVYSQNIMNKDRMLNQIQDILDDIIVGTQNQQQNSQQNINLISQIENDNLHANLMQGHKQKRSQHSMKKKSLNQQNIHLINNDLVTRKSISQNINIIQVNSQSRYGMKKQTNNSSQIKNSKINIQAIKRKARQNMKDRQLSHSRKMQLSRSIENATDILNKIQERNFKL